MSDITFGSRKLAKEISDGNVVCEIYEKEVVRDGNTRLYHDISFFRVYDKDGITHREPFIQQRDFDRIHILTAEANIFIKRRIYKMNREAMGEN